QKASAHAGSRRHLLPSDQLNTLNQELGAIESALDVWFVLLRMEPKPRLALERRVQLVERAVDARSSLFQIAHDVVVRQEHSACDCVACWEFDRDCLHALPSVS